MDFGVLVLFKRVFIHKPSGAFQAIPNSKSRLLFIDNRVLQQYLPFIR